MIKTKVAFLEGWPFSNQSELFDNFSDCSDWPDKSDFCFDHVNKLSVTFNEMNNEAMRILTVIRVGRAQIIGEENSRIFRQLHFKIQSLLKEASLCIKKV